MKRDTPATDCLDGWPRVAMISVNQDGLMTYKHCSARWAFMSVEGERSRGVNVLAVKAIRSPLARLTKHLATHPRGVTDLHTFKSRAMVPVTIAEPIRRE
jgi:hypothetical protein